MNYAALRIPARRAAEIAAVVAGFVRNREIVRVLRVSHPRGDGGSSGSRLAAHRGRRR